MSQEQRSSIVNGIWLCQTCSRLIDSDVPSHSVDTLREWKNVSEMTAYLALRGLEVVQFRSYERLERKLPELIAEMRVDLSENLYVREFIIMSKRTSYNGSRKKIFNYYFEDHEDLHGKVKICENYGAIIDITYNSVDRFRFTEDFVDYLLGAD